MGVTSPYNFDLLPIGCGGFDLIYSTNPSFSGSKRALFSREGHSDSLANPEDKPREEEPLDVKVIRA